MRSQFESERQQFQEILTQQQQQFESLAAQQQAPQQQSELAMANPLVDAFGRGYEEGDPARMLQAAAQYTQQPLIEAVGRLMDEKLSALSPQMQQQQAFQREANLRMAEANYAARIGHEQYQQLMPAISNVLSANQNWLPGERHRRGLRGGDRQRRQARPARLARLAPRGGGAGAHEKLAAQTLSGAGRGSVYTRGRAGGDAAADPQRRQHLLRAATAGERLATSAPPVYPSRQ